MELLTKSLFDCQSVAGRYVKVLYCVEPGMSPEMNTARK